MPPRPTSPWLRVLDRACLFAVAALILALEYIGERRANAPAVMLDLDLDPDGGVWVPGDDVLAALNSVRN